MKNRDMDPLQLSMMVCNTMMKKFPAEDLPPARHFHYHQGVFLSGVEQTYFNTGDAKYAKYIKRWIDSLIMPYGEIRGYNQMTLDDKQASTLLFRLYHETGEEKYVEALHYVRYPLDLWPLNKEGGFWHMLYNNKKNQMWLDGLYMVGELLVRYGVEFNDKKSIDMAFRQAKLMWDNIRDKKTGLLYHAWDSSCEAKWADKKTGCSPEFWGRASGWYIVALTIMLDYLPKDYSCRQELVGFAEEYVKAFTKYQDEETGLWYQVIDKKEDLGNWTETSCSALFLCGISKAVENGYVDASYKKYADKAYEGLVNTLRFEDDEVIMPKICIGTGVGNYEHYISRPTSENDLHGVGALLLGCNAYHKLLQLM